MPEIVAAAPPLRPAPVDALPRAPTLQAAADAPPRKLPMWQDDSSCAFFRRLSWSPDGAFLLAPSGLFQDGPDAPTRNACFLLPRGDAARPAVVLPGLGTPSVAARFCPKAFRLPVSAACACSSITHTHSYEVTGTPTVGAHGPPDSQQQPTSSLSSHNHSLHALPRLHALPIDPRTLRRPAP